MSDLVRDENHVCNVDGRQPLSLPMRACWSIPTRRAH